MSTPATIKLPQASVEYLKQVLNTPAWYGDQIVHLKHGVDAFDAIPETPEAPSISLPLYHEWNTKEVAFELTAKQVKAVKKCLDFHAPRASLPANRYSVALLKAFDIKMGDEEAE